MEIIMLGPWMLCSQNVLTQTMDDVPRNYKKSKDSRTVHLKAPTMRRQLPFGFGLLPLCPCPAMLGPNPSALDNSFMECWLLHLEPNLHPLGERKYLHVLPFPPPLPPPLAPLPFPPFYPRKHQRTSRQGCLILPFWQPVLQPKSQTRPTNVCGRI